jgi:PAS domain S-box-containing protein
MEHEDRLLSYAHSPWEQRDEFLLLPGDGLILVSGNGRIRFFDNRARLLLGTAASQALGEQVEMIWPELAELLEHHTIGIDQQGPRDTQVDVRGQPQAVRLFRSDDGMGVVLLGDRAALQGVASQQLLMHQRILAQLRDSVIVTTAEPIDAPGPVIVYANQAALRQTGYRLEEVLGRSPRMFQGAGTDPADLRTFRDAMSHWQPVRQTLLNYRKNGRPFWVEIDITPLSDRDGWYTYWVSVQRECKPPSKVNQELG